MLQRVPHDWTRTAPPHSPVQLLIEASDPALTVSDFSRFHEAGFSVALCSGEAAAPDGCPLLHGGQCQLLSSADVVLRHLDSHRSMDATARRIHPAPHVLSLGDGGDVSSAAPMDSQIRALRHLLSAI